MTPLEEIFCTYNGVTHTGPLPLATAKGNPIVAVPGTLGLTEFMDAADPLNPCNCASFFAIPNEPIPPFCAMAPHVEC